MKKRIALLLALALCLSSLAGLTAVAEGETETTPEVEYCTVPMTAEVCIYFAVKSDDQDAADGIKTAIQLSVWKGADVAEENASVYTLKPSSYTKMGDEIYLVYCFDKLSAAEMDTVVNAKVVGGETIVSYSVAQWANDYITANEGNDEYASYVTLVNKMLNYGKMAKAYADASAA